jgi:subtilisin family serine protease
MKCAFAVAAVAALVASGSTFAGVADHGQAYQRLVHAPRSADYEPGEILVGFHRGVNRSTRARSHARTGAHVERTFTELGVQLVQLPRGLSVQAAARLYRHDPSVRWAEPNYRRYPQANLFPQQWDLNNTAQLHTVTDVTGDDTANPHAGAADADIDAPEAWAVEDGSTNHPVIAVIDTGVDVTQPDLSGQLWQNPGEAGGTPGVDDDGNGKVDDVNGWDFGDGDNGLLSANPFLDHEHGTHVAGTIAADNDSDGITGVCPGCRIMVLKIARDSTGAMPLSKEIAAINYAKAEGANVINMSLGAPQFANSEREAIRKSGLLTVVAAGNDSLDNDMALAADIDGNGTADVFSPSYPAAYTVPNILTVGASNDLDENAYFTECHSVTVGLSKPRCAFTDWGHDSVDVSAPGVDILSTFPGGLYQTWDGTSMATPHVAGIAGLLLSQTPGLTPAQVKNAIMHGVDKPAALKTMFIAPPANTAKTGSFTRTDGRVNALSALSASTANATPVTDGNIDHAASWSSSSKSGSVKWSSDVNDVFKRKLSRSHTYRFTLVVPSGKDYDLWVWKPGTKEIWQFDPSKRLQKASASSGARDEVVQFTAKKTGTYYVQVSAWLFKAGGYTLKFKRVS